MSVETAIFELPGSTHPPNFSGTLTLFVPMGGPLGLDDPGPGSGGHWLLPIAAP